MGSCKIPSQLVGCLSTLSSCWALSWPRSQDKLEINFYKPASMNNRFNSFNNSNSSSSNQDSSRSNKDNNNSSDNKVGSGNKVGSSNQDSSSSNQVSSSNSNQDNSSSNQDSSSNSNQDSSSNSNQDSSDNNQDSSNSNQDSSSSKADSHLSKDSHPSKQWTDSVDLLLLLLLNKISNKFHPDPKFSSTLRCAARIMVGSPWSYLMKSSLALPGTSWRSQAETTPNGSPTQERFSTGSSPTSCFRVEILRISMEPVASPSTDPNSTTRTSW